MSDVKTMVRGYVEENILLGQKLDGFTDDASFLGLGILDSTAVLELVAFVEERLGVKVAVAEMVPSNLDSLEQIEAFVRRKQEGAVP